MGAVRLDGLVVAHDVSGGGGGHWGEQKGVAHSVGLDFLSEHIPVLPA